MAPEQKSSSNRDVSVHVSYDVRVVNMCEYKKAAACLAEAFADDAAIRYPIDTRDMAHYSEEYKRKLHDETMEYVCAAHIYNGLVTTMGPNHASVAIWLPPGKSIDGWLTLLRSGLWRMYYRLSKEGRKRFFAEFLPLLHDTKRDVLDERDDESYYLVYLGTRPTEQCKGYGTALIEHITQKADAEGRACYLESTADKNTGMYRARGFVFKKKIYLNYGEAPIALDIMVREPQCPPKSTGTGSGTVGLKGGITAFATVTTNGVAVDKISPAA